MTDKTNDILEHYGDTHQIIKTIEELGELQSALARWLNKERVSREDVITEIADVKIMAEQMAWHFGKNEVDKEVWRKIERQVERINEKL